MGELWGATKAVAPWEASVSNPAPTAANPNETVTANSPSITMAGVTAKMVVNYQHIAPLMEAGSTGANGVVTFASFAVVPDGKQRSATETVSVTIASGPQAASCTATFVDDV